MNPFPKGPEDIKALVTKRAKCWAFTVYNLPSTGQLWIDWMRQLLSEDEARCFLWSVEICPSTGTEHAHVGIWFTRQLRYNELGKMLKEAGLKAWKSVMKSWQKYQDYAMKDLKKEEAPEFEPRFLLEGSLPDRPGTAYDDPMEDGGTELQERDSRKRKGKEKRKRLTEEQATMVLTGRTAELIDTLTALEAVELGPTIREAAQMLPPRRTPPTVVWFYGESGTAKSALAQWIPESKGCSVAFVNLSKESHFWQGYSAQEILVLDEVRSDALTFELFLKLANWTPLTVEVKNSSIAVRSHLLVITSPRPPWDFWEDAVDERGHEKDLWQAMRRISLVVKFLPTDKKAQHPHWIAHRVPVWKKQESFVTLAGLLSQDEKDFNEATEIGMSRNATEINRWLDQKENAEKEERWAPVPLDGFRAWGYANPRQTIAIFKVVESVIIFSPKLRREDQTEWTKAVALPVNMSEELEEALMEELERGRELKVATVAVWERHESKISEIMLEHYLPQFRMCSYE